MKEAEMSPTACERLPRVAVGWLIDVPSVSWMAVINQPPKQINIASAGSRDSLEAVYLFIQVIDCGKGLQDTITRRGKAQRGFSHMPTSPFSDCLPNSGCHQETRLTD